MKQTVRVIDDINNTVIEKTFEIPDKAHLEAQIKYPSRIYRDKTKYTRKQKHCNHNDY